MPPIEELITEIKGLTPEQMDEVARVVRRFSRTDNGEISGTPAVPSSIVDEAVNNGWPARLFSDLIGSIPDLERAPQPLAGESPNL
jgi:hypothetical protein